MAKDKRKKKLNEHNRLSRRIGSKVLFFYFLFDETCAFI